MPKGILLLLFVTLPLFLSSQTRMHSIIIEGGISSLDNQPVRSVKVDVCVGNKIINSIETNSGGKYKITLDKGNPYILQYSKTGFITKKIAFSTELVTDDDLKYGILPVVLDLSMCEYIHGLDISGLKNPVAKFSYSDYEGDFVYDKDYSEKMVKEVEKIIAASKKLRKEAYDKYISQGDFLYSEDWPEDACVEYMNALLVFPDESYPKKQVDKIRAQLQKDIQAEKTYSTHVSHGDKNFGRQNYKVSKSYYQKSLIYKPEETYPKNRISEIEKLLADNPDLFDKPEKDAVEYTVLADNKTGDQNNNNTATNQNDNNKNQTQNNKSQNNNKNQTANKNVTDNIYSKNSGISEISSKSTPIDKNITDENKNEYLNDLLDKYKKSGDSTNVARVHIAMGIEAFNDQSFDQAAEHFRESYELFGNAGMTSDQAAVAESLADIYFSMYRYSASADWYTRANTLYKDIGNNEKASGTLLKSADASYSAGDMEQALSKYMLCVDESGKNNDLSSVYNSIGVIHFEIGNFNEALKYFDFSITNAETKGNIKEVALSLNNIGNVKYEDKDYNSALQYYNRSVMAKNRIDYKAGIAVSLFNIANVYRKTGDFKKALEYYFKAEKFAIASGNTDVVYENYGALAEIYSKTKDCENAVKYYKLYAETRHLIARRQGHDQINESTPYYANMLDKGSDLDILKDEMRKQRLLAMYETAKKEREIEYLNIQNQLNNQRLENSQNQIRIQRFMIAGALTGFFLLILFTIMLFRQFKHKKRANFLLAEQNEEIKSQKQEIESQRDLLYTQKEKIMHIHSELTDSIRYAQRIQNAVLSSIKVLTDTFGESFVMYKPVELVSGDFYWACRAGNRLLFCVSDCTGHGVPGAFMSMLGISFLNDIVQHENQIQPDIILNYLRESTINALGQKEISDRYGMARIRDGMDIALCSINLDTLELQFAGANNPVYIIKQHQNIAAPTVDSSSSSLPAATAGNTACCGLTEIKGDKMPIGIHERMDTFTLRTHQLQKGDTIYLFSDGYVDQFGGPKEKKFKNKALKELLISINAMSMAEQKSVLEKTHDNWKGSLHQIDDISMLGVKI